MRKRSSCASGSGNVPSWSIGFCVAITRNGGLRRWVDAVDRDAAFGHRLQQRGLRARRGAVDFVGQHDLGEDRPGAELELARLLIEDRAAGHVGRQQVGRALDALETCSRRCGRTPGPASSWRRRARLPAGRALRRYQATSTLTICCRLPTTTCSTLAMIRRLTPARSIDARGFSDTKDYLFLTWRRTPSHRRAPPFSLAAARGIATG